MAITINPLALLAAAAIMNLIGFLWYSPWLFAKRWEKLAGVKMKSSKRAHIVNFCASLIMSYVLAYGVAYVQAKTFTQGMAVGFFAWLGFIATTSLGLVLWERKPVALYVLNNMYYLISLMLMAGLFAVW
ncbi:MAG: DUF1761 domain-containing protein [Nanoarchaeota archaeon]